MRDGALGHRDHDDGESLRVAAQPGRAQGGCVGDGGGEAGGRQERARTGVHRCSGRVLRRLGDHRAPAAGGGLREGHGRRCGAVSAGRGSTDTLCPRAERHGAAHRQDVRQSTQGGWHPRAVAQAVPRPPGGRPLPDSYLRLCPAGREGASRRPGLRRDRAVGPARVAHALAPVQQGGPVARWWRGTAPRMRLRRTS